MSANADWVVPATADERRYFVLDVSERRRGNPNYFTALYRAIHGAQLSAFLAYLLNLDLADFDFRNPPHTAALNRQKLRSADSLTAFWYDCLIAGAIVGIEDTDWPLTIVTQALFGAYVRYAHDHGDRHPLSDAMAVKKLAELLPDSGFRPFRPRLQGGDRPPSYKLPSLDECRAAFLAAMKIDGHGGAWWDGGPWPAETRGNPGAVSEDGEDGGFSNSLYESNDSDSDFPHHGTAETNLFYHISIYIMVTTLTGMTIRERLRAPVVMGRLRGPDRR